LAEVTLLTLLLQVSEVTKAKAAVINEKLQWEELDKQEQVQKCTHNDRIFFLIEG
jgi:hypothetical protein